MYTQIRKYIGGAAGVQEKKVNIGLHIYTEANHGKINIIRKIRLPLVFISYQSRLQSKTQGCHKDSER